MKGAFVVFYGHFSMESEKDELEKTAPQKNGFYSGLVHRDRVIGSYIGFPEVPLYRTLYRPYREVIRDLHRNPI